MDLIAKKNIALLESQLVSTPPQGKIESEIENQKIKDIVTVIMEDGLDYIVSEKINPVGVEELDDIIEDFTNAFYRMTQYLKNHGFVEIHGYQVSKKTNI